MREFDEFENWIETSGTSREIGEMASQAAMEYIQAGMADTLTAQQQEAIFNLAIRVSSQVSAGLLRAYHNWANNPAG